MVDKMRWRYMDTNPVVAAVNAATVIEIGDLLWQDIDNAKPARDLDVSSLANPATEQFAAKFLGVAMQRSHAGDTAPIRVAATGVFDFDRVILEPAELGDFVELSFEELAAGKLDNQLVTLTRGSHRAIARVVKRASREAKTLLISIRSTVITGGIQDRLR